MKKVSAFSNYRSLVLLFLPAIGFFLFYFSFPNLPVFTNKNWGVFPIQVWLMVVSGGIGTLGGLLDWRYHRNPLNLHLPEKERLAEAYALGLGGGSLFVLMCLASLSKTPSFFLIPIVISALFTTTLICYDEFVFHRKRCKPKENRYHSMLIFGNGIAWLCWLDLIYGQ